MHYALKAARRKGMIAEVMLIAPRWVFFTLTRTVDF